MSLEQALQFPELDWLCEMCVEPCAHRGVTIVLSSIARHGGEDKGHASRLCTKLGGDFVAAHVRQTDVYERHARKLLTGQPKRLAAVSGNAHAMSGHFQKFGKALPRVAIVVNNQNVPR